jgi:hypothetical protein
MMASTNALRDGGAVRRAGVLLEVVIALTVLVAAMGMLGAQVVGGLNWTAYAEEQLRASHLADRVLALVELDPNIQRRISEAGTTPVEDVFGEQAFPGYFWRVQVEPVDPDDPNEELGLVTVEVLRQADPQRRDEIEGAQVVRTLAFLRARPATIDLSQVGMDPNVVSGLPSDLAGQLGPLLSALGGLDMASVTPQQIVSAVDQETLQTIMPLLQTLLSQAGGGDLMPGGLQGLFGRGGEGAGTEGEGLRGPPGEGPEGGSIGGGEPPVPGRPPMGPGGPGPGTAPLGPRGGGGVRPPPMPGMPPPMRPPPGGADLPKAGEAPGPRPRRAPPTTAGGSGEGGRYTLEDLMNLRDQWRRQQEGAK